MHRPFLFTFIVALSGAFLPAIATSQSLWRDDISKPMFADKCATHAGHIVPCVAANVIMVLPKCRLVVQGRRETAFGGEEQTVRMRGVVRIEDIAAKNTVFS